MRIKTLKQDYEDIIKELQNTESELKNKSKNMNRPFQLWKKRHVTLLKKKKKFYSELIKVESEILEHEKEFKNLEIFYKDKL